MFSMCTVYLELEGGDEDVWWISMSTNTVYGEMRLNYLFGVWYASVKYSRRGEEGFWDLYEKWEDSR